MTAPGADPPATRPPAPETAAAPAAAGPATPQAAPDVAPGPAVPQAAPDVAPGPAAGAETTVGPAVVGPRSRAVARVADATLRILAGVVATLLAVLLALVQGFLLPTRILDTPAPVASFVLAFVGNVALIRFARHATGSGLGIVGPCVAWLGTLLVLGSRTSEGDLVLPGDWRALVLLFGGTGVLAVAGFLAATPGVVRPQAVAPLAVGPTPSRGAAEKP